MKYTNNFFNYASSMLQVYLFSCASIILTIFYANSSNASDLPLDLTMENNDITPAWHIGRLSFRLPINFSLVGQNHKMYGVSINTELLTEEYTAENAWSKHTSKISKLDTPEHINIKEVQLKGNFEGIFYNKITSNIKTLTLDAQKSYSNHLLKLSYEGKPDNPDKILKLVEAVAEGYLPDNYDGFSDGLGSIISSPSRSEEASILLTDKTNTIKLSIKTRAVLEESTSHPLKDIDEDLEILKKQGGEGEVLLDQMNKIANINGYEGKVKTSIDGSSNLKYTWYYGGTPNSPYEPKIIIKATGPEDLENILDETWEILLRSLRIKDNI